VGIIPQKTRVGHIQERREIPPHTPFQ